MDSPVPRRAEGIEMTTEQMCENAIKYGDEENTRSHQ